MAVVMLTGPVGAGKRRSHGTQSPFRRLLSAIKGEALWSLFTRHEGRSFPFLNNYAITTTIERSSYITIR